MTIQEKVKLEVISACIGSPLTEEQMEFASDFTKDTISFSDPGTGKTHTLIAGLILAQTYHKIPANNINCMSFTNAAVSEMAGRYETLCKKCAISTGVIFNTFHSLSLKILKDAYPTMEVTSIRDWKEDIECMKSYLDGFGIEVGEDKSYIRRVIKAIDDLNSSLTYHPENIERKFVFQQLGLPVDVFQELRKKWFLRGIITRKIMQGDIPLYCLYALRSKEEIIQKWKGKYKIMVVDEFQDLSLLHLQILSYISNTLIVIGDMKQQIYAFNGACPQITKEYLKLHPEARICNLTQSFRCGQEIADFATKIILPNDKSYVGFTGHNRGSSVSLVSRKNLDWKKIVSDIGADRTTNRAKARDVMFLYRNNASAIPLIDELYKNNIPFRCSKFAKIMDLPMFESLSKLACAAWKPNDLETVNKALRLFPEFAKVTYGTEIPVVSAMRASGKSILDINYKWRNYESAQIIAAMREANNAILQNKSAGVVYMKLMSVYKEFIYKNEWWKMDASEDFYMSLAAPVCNNKTFPIMYNEELDKESQNVKCIKAMTGIRCYTMHAAKGLEADDVYILDCDDGMFPNSKVMKDKVKKECYLDVATDIRSERNLLFVAVTRAKYNVIISYSGAAPARLVTNPGDAEFTVYDEIYEHANHEYDDADEFFKLFRIGVYKVANVG